MSFSALERFDISIRHLTDSMYASSTIEGQCSVGMAHEVSRFTAEVSRLVPEVSRFVAEVSMLRSGVSRFVHQVSRLLVLLNRFASIFSRFRQK